MFEDSRLKIFMAVADKGSFTLAGRQLGISQPAVSQNIAELEKILGTELFIRSRSSVTLTSAGTAFMEYASNILHWYSAAEAMFGPEGRLSGKKHIRIECSSFVAEHILGKAVRRLLAADSRASIETVSPGQKGDVRIFTKPHRAQLSLEENGTFVRSLDAAAVTCSSRISSLRGLPQGTRLAVWTEYSEMLPPDLSALAAFCSASCEAVCALVAESPEFVGLVPSDAAPSGLRRLDADLAFLRLDIHIQAGDRGMADRLRALLET